MSFGRELKKVVATIAPTIGTALGGPMGGVAMKFLADRFTGGDTGKVEDYLLSASPEQLKDLKLADMEFKKEMAELGVRLEELHVGDRANARDMAIKRGLHAQVALSALYTVGYFGTLALLIMGWAEVPEHMEDLVKVLLGGLAGPQLSIVQFWFGSSRGSKDKSEALLAAVNG